MLVVHGNCTVSKTKTAQLRWNTDVDDKGSKMNQSQKYIVGWDFSKKPSGSFYRILLDEFGTSHPGGDYELIQRSVTLCRDNFIASRLVTLAEHFGARVVCYAVVGEALFQDQQHEAQEFLSRILQQRLKRRGRRK